MSAEGLPPGWRRVRFGDVVRQVKDKVNPETAGIDRYVAGEHMDTDDLHVRRWGQVGDGYLGPAFHMRFKPGQVLYGSRRTYLRKIAVADFEGICANTTFVVESATEDLLPTFLPYVMTTKSFHEHSIKQSKGSVNPYINFSDLKWYDFALPPPEEQQRVIEIVSSLDGVCESFRAAEARAAELIDAISEEAWCRANKVRLGSLGAVATGKTPATRTSDYWVPAELPFFTPGDFGSGVGYLGSAERMVSRLGAEAARLLPKCSLLQTCIGAQFGRVAVTLTEGSCNQQVNALIGLPDSDAVFAAHMLACSSGQSALRRVAGTTTLPQVKKSSWAAIELPWPDDGVRKAFSVRIAQATSLLEGTRQQQRALVALRRQLLNDSLGGCCV